jgi:hypothetical protein
MDSVTNELAFHLMIKIFAIDANIDNLLNQGCFFHSLKLVLNKNKFLNDEVVS